MLRGRHLQCLGRGVDGKGGAIAAPAPLHDGQAHARTGDRGADGDEVGVITAGDRQTPQFLILFLNFNDFP